MQLTDMKGTSVGTLNITTYGHNCGAAFRKKHRVAVEMAQ